MRAWVLVLTACSSSSSKMPDAGPPPFTVYLNFEGVTLAPTMAGMDNAATNLSSIVTASTTVPPYLQGVATRDTTIASIVSETQARFSPFHVDVVTERPAALDYFMIVYTGQPSVVFGPGNGAGVSAVTSLPCSNPSGGAAAVPNGIAFQFQSAATSDQYMPIARGNLAIPLVALAQNINPTAATNDCLCFAAANCGLGTTACTIGGPGTPVDTAHGCSGAPASEDEMALLVQTLGAAP